MAWKPTEDMKFRLENSEFFFAHAPLHMNLYNIKIVLGT